jgi:hypothetical protein
MWPPAWGCEYKHGRLAGCHLNQGEMELPILYRKE